MSNRSKRKVVGSRVSVARTPSALSLIRGSITGTLVGSNEIQVKLFEIKLPCSLADMASEIAESSFAVCEALAFKAGIKFLPAKEIEKSDGPYFCNQCGISSWTEYCGKCGKDLEGGPQTKEIPF